MVFYCLELQFPAKGDQKIEINRSQNYSQMIRVVISLTYVHETMTNNIVTTHKRTVLGTKVKTLAFLFIFALLVICAELTSRKQTFMASKGFFSCVNGK